MGCTGDRCPMQAPFEVKNCKKGNCYFRTEGYGKNGVQKRTLLERALKIWGEEAQTRKLSEEMAELWVEICHMQLGRGEMEKLAEEIADVRIMLDQMEILFSCEGAVNTMEDKKLERLAERLGL